MSYFIRVGSDAQRPSGAASDEQPYWPSAAGRRILRDLAGHSEHGEQGFDYHLPVCAGDTVTVRSAITDIYDKKNGALEFVVKTSVATNQHGARVAELRTVIVCRH